MKLISVVVVEACLDDDEFAILDNVHKAVMRRDQALSPRYFSGSGLPIPASGWRSASSMSRLMRLSMDRSAVCQ